jgi:NitT/TauT family transport system substrate-binding protein
MWGAWILLHGDANPDFMRNNPVATKRAMRALLRATNLCHKQPEWAARRMVEEGFSYECALQTLRDVR